MHAQIYLLSQMIETVYGTPLEYRKHQRHYHNVMKEFPFTVSNVCKHSASYVIGQETTNLFSLLIIFELVQFCLRGTSWYIKPSVHEGSCFV